MVKGTAHGWVNCELSKWKTKPASTVEADETQKKKHGEAGEALDSCTPQKWKLCHLHNFFLKSEGTLKYKGYFLINTMTLQIMFFSI